MQVLALAWLVTLVSAILLWLAATLLDLVAPSRQPLARGADTAAVVLAGAGLWWPLQAMLALPQAVGSLGVALPVLGLALAAAAAELSVFALRPQLRQSLLLRLGCGVLAGLVMLGCGLVVTVGHAQSWPERLRFVAEVAVLPWLGFGALLLIRGQGWRALAGRALVALAAAAPCAAVLLIDPLGTLAEMPNPLPTSVALLSLAWLGLVLLRNASMHKNAAAAAASGRFTDPLTGMPTRLGIENHLSAAVVECDRDDTQLAVLLFDLDGFNPINSSFGHDSGDALLRQAAERLRDCLAAGDVVGRIGGDEFVVLLKQVGGKERITEFVTRAMQSLSHPYRVGTRELGVSCSVGVARYPADGGRARMLVCADAAKNAAKRLGGACYCFYTAGMDGDTREQLDLLHDLRQALVRKEMELYFQPKIDAVSGEVTAAEALLRWRHPARGMVSPVIFIPVAERFGFMRELGNWVIDDACRQARVWRENGLRMRVAINLSAHQMRQTDIVERVQSALAQYRIHPSLLTCEITESVAMEYTQATQDTFKRLGDLGVHLSIDDFGTGYSSLSYLRRLPAKELKVDRAFITDIASSADARAVVDAVIKLAHALGLRVVAEGVETQAQQLILLEMGCDEFQGYLFAKPMSAQAILLWALDDSKNAAPAFRASLFGDTMTSDDV